MTRYQTRGEGPYNIGQEARIIGAEVKKHCSMPPYIRLVNQCKDSAGFVTMRAVEVYDDGRAMADIGNFLGAVMVPYEAMLF